MRIKLDMPTPRPQGMAAALCTGAACAALMAGCATGGPGGGAKPPPAPVPATTPPEAARTQSESTAAPPAAPMAPGVAQRTLSSAIELLEAGQEDAALVEIDKVLAAEAGNRLAQSLARQIREEPTALLGRESFSYRVAPGESLSLIAQRALGDRFLFYALARYNGIRVPRQLAGGQLIRVPGRSMPQAAAPAPAPDRAPVPPPSVAPAPAAAPAAAPAPAPVAPPPDPARAEREKAATVARHVREARSAFARQDLDAAIAAWTRVLDVDPSHRTAAAERQRAIDLNERAKKLPAAR